MADASKSSFLGSITPWSRSGTPPPRSPRKAPSEEPLRQSTGLDHTISLRPSPSLRRYPNDCPPLKARWYYAVDVAKRKPFAPEPSAEDKAKPPPVPKKLVGFSLTDSQAIESAYLSLDKGTSGNDDPPTSAKITSTRVPVNEDYLFDVHVEKRELEPAYWLGPVYEVRRGTWFYHDGSSLRPCDENLANQLEEGYLKITPWKRGSLRSVSQPRSRPTSIVEGPGIPKPLIPPNSSSTGEAINSNSYRLFGAHMNTTVTYQDANTAFLSTDDFMSRMSSTVYESFGGTGGTKVVRGWIDLTKTADPKANAESSTPKEKRKSQRIVSDMESSIDLSTVVKSESETQPAQRPKRTALERQLSSLAGLTESQDSEKLAEEDAREQEEQEMEESRDTEGEDQARQIDHLVLVTHGIGQRLGLRLDSINFVHDVNTLRKTMKAVYKSAPDLQALNSDPNNCKIQVLPICWRHLLDFPKQSLRQNRKEFDIGDLDSRFDDEYPSLQDITVEGVPAVRNLITDLAMDVLLYQSAYREHIATIVKKEANRIYKLFRQRTGFNGKVSFCGHSLGSAVLFDILCRQEEPAAKTRPRRVSSRTSRDFRNEQTDLSLDFDVENFFALGSPIALFQMLKGRTIAGRATLKDKDVPTSPFDPDPMSTDPFDQIASKFGGGRDQRDLIPIATSSPKCSEVFNIFHPTDPIAYRMEPLISSAMAQLKPQPLPYTKKGLFGAPGIANLSARVGQQVMLSWYSLTSGVASSLINRSLGITGENEQALPQDKSKATQPAPPPPPPPQFSPELPMSPRTSGPLSPGGTPMPVADAKRQQDLADAAKTADSDHIPTLIDSELETLYAGFQKRRKSRISDASDDLSNIEYQSEQEKARKLKHEEAKVKALNSNGRVDYHIQEGMFDVSLLASIASHLSYWADEDVMHFMIGQMLKSGRYSRRGTAV